MGSGERASLWSGCSSRACGAGRSVTFGSNVLPRKFGRDSVAPGPWACYCTTVSTVRGDWTNDDPLRQDTFTVRRRPGYLKRCPDCGAERPK